MPTKTLIRSLSPSLTFAGRLFRRRTVTPLLLDPLHSDVPMLRRAEMAAIYHGNRTAGDFYEFLRVSPSRVLFGLFDIAGRRADTRNVLIAAQNTFRTLAPHLFAAVDLNEGDALIEISQQLNRTILRDAGVRSCPAFLGCYHEDLGTVCYTNAGHTSALLRDSCGITELPASDLPLGLFSHTTRNASTCTLAPDAAILVVSRGMVEMARQDGEEYGLEGVKRAFQQSFVPTARQLCLATLRAAQQFTKSPPTHNDVTALALVRSGIQQ